MSSERETCIIFISGKFSVGEAHSRILCTTQLLPFGCSFCLQRHHRIQGSASGAVHAQSVFFCSAILTHSKNFSERRLLVASANVNRVASVTRRALGVKYLEPETVIRADNLAQLIIIAPSFHREL